MRVFTSGRTSLRAVLVAIVALCMLTYGSAAYGAAPAPLTAVGVLAYSPPTYSAGSISLSVVSAVDTNPTNKAIKPNAGDPVGPYEWIINADDTGNPGTQANPLFGDCLPATARGTHSSDPNYADTCPWPSTRETGGWAAIVAEGDQSDFAGKTLALPGGKYLISVKAAGFKIDGAHFTVNGGTQHVTVGMNPTPLPLSKLRIQVFDDFAPVDGTYEVDAESSVDMSGFRAHINDVFGAVSTDYYGNALCTSYVHTVATNPASPIKFDADGRPIVDAAKTPACVSDRTGVITIPNLGPNRYSAVVSPPSTTGFTWVQTTTLEGAHDHDIWIQEGDTGNDTEQIRGQEQVPATQFGFVKTQSLAKSATDTTRSGGIKGIAVQGLPFIAGQGGSIVPETGVAGAKIGPRLDNFWVALSDLTNGDQQVYVGKGNSDGTFAIPNVADGSYQVTLWDDPQDMIIDSFVVEVDAAAHPGTAGWTDIGQHMLVGWFSRFHGSVFNDTNGNGVKDPGEQGVPGFTLTLRERDNTLMDQYTNTVTTNEQGVYDLTEGYPLSRYLVLEAFNTRYRTTGVTWQGDNDPEPTTQLGGMVDLNVLPIIGLNGKVDWGVEPIPAAENGGIAGTVSYDTTRNELDPAEAVSEAYQPGIPGITVNLYLSVDCTTTDADLAKIECRQGKQIVPLNAANPAYDPSAPNSATNAKYLDTANPAPNRGAFVKGAKANSYVSESWKQNRGCTARQWDGAELDSTMQQALPESGTSANRLCVEAPMMGFQAGVSDRGDQSTDGSTTVNGNYGFTDSTVNQYPRSDTAHNPDGLAIGAPLPDGQTQPLAAADFIVGVDIPRTPVGDRPMYKVTSEEDVNVFDGNTYLPQENYPPTSQDAAGVPVGAPDRTPKPPSQPPSQQAGITSSCVGPLHTVHVRSVPVGDPADPQPGVYNPNFNDGGGTPFEGYDRPSCQDKLVTVRSGQTTAPNFNLFTDVPIPTHFWGLTINDLGLQLDTRSTGLGEAQGLPFVPIGLYDWAGRLVDTVHTDFNGMYEALEPSTDTFNCPVPAGPCPNMYRMVGNDPGQPGALNPDYNPRFRTIAVTFQGWPGLFTVTDQAPTQAAATVLAPSGTPVGTTACNLSDDVPQLLAASTPYIRSTAGSNRTVTIRGFGFGSAPGTITLRDPKAPGMPEVTPTAIQWGPNAITFTVPPTYKPIGSNGNTPLTGSLQVSITGSNGQAAFNTISLLALGTATAGTAQSSPRLYEVGPGKTYATIQAALDAVNVTTKQLYNAVVVWPNTQTSTNPDGDYNENLVVHNQVLIQGVGPGGFDDHQAFVPGTIIDGSGFDMDLPSGQKWLDTVGRQAYAGLQELPDAAVITVLAATSAQPPAVIGGPGPNGAGKANTVWPVAIDGFQIRNGAQANNNVNANNVTGAVKTPVGAGGAMVTQGGGIYVHQKVLGMRITNDLLAGNSGSYGGAIRVGTPYVSGNGNFGTVISHNQIRDNGGTNLAGGIGLFAGSDGYSVDHNAICGNHSSEYGGGLTAMGYNRSALLPGSKTARWGDANTIDHNRIWFNQSYDEGGGVMILGELPANPSDISEGSGPVAIDSNVIQANLANDDGGGVRLLQTSGSHVATTGCTTDKKTGAWTCPASGVTTDTITITNDTITNNVSTHEGGGIALDDAAFVTVANNTVVRNITTATAMTSDGLPAPAGLSAGTLSDQLIARLSSQPGFTGMISGGTSIGRPTLFNNAFSDNYAGTYYNGVVYGITDADANRYDIGTPDNAADLDLTMTGSYWQAGDHVVGSTPSGSLTPNDLQIKKDFSIDVSVVPLRQFPAFRQAAIITAVLPYQLLGDFDLTAGSPAVGRGVASAPLNYGPITGLPAVSAPTSDIHGSPRPSGTTARFDAGSAQYK